VRQTGWWQRLHKQFFLFYGLVEGGFILSGWVHIASALSEDFS